MQVECWLSQRHGAGSCHSLCAQHSPLQRKFILAPRLAMAQLRRAIFLLPGMKHANCALGTNLPAPVETERPHTTCSMKQVGGSHVGRSQDSPRSALPRLRRMKAPSCVWPLHPSQGISESSPVCSMPQGGTGLEH